MSGNVSEALRTRAEASTLRDDVRDADSGSPRHEMELFDEYGEVWLPESATLADATRGGGGSLDLRSKGNKIYGIWSNIAHILQASSLAFVKSGRNVEAKRAIDDAAIILRILHASFPSEFRENLAVCLQIQGAILYTTRSFDEAVQAHRESINLTRPLFEANPGRERSRLADRLDNYAISLCWAGQRLDAVAAAKECLEHTRVLWETKAGLFGARLAVRAASLHAMTNAGHIDAESRRDKGEGSSQKEALPRYAATDASSHFLVRDPNLK